MPHIYKEVRALQNAEKIDDGECVSLVKKFTQLGWTGSWKEGVPVVGNRQIEQGTAVATFVNGKWPGKSTGNHSGFYMGQVADGIYIMEQWPKKKLIGKRFIRRKGKDKNGNYITPEDNADAFSVIE